MAGQKRVTQEDIARACKIDQGSVSRILNEDTRDSFAKETVDKVFQVAREIGYLHPALVVTNRRLSDRKKAGMAARLQIFIGTNTLYDEGTVRVDEMSMSGMLLRDFQTRKASFPTDRFRFDVEIQEGKLKGLKLRCRIVRFSDKEDEFALGCKFEGLDEDGRQRIKGFVR